MENKWTKIMTTPDEIESSLIQGLLKENGIECLILNKKDSAYGTFGDVEIYVIKDNVIPALKIINDHKE